MPAPIVLFNLQFTLSLVLYALIALWFVAPRLSKLPREVALQPLVLVHCFRIIGGSILAPGSVGAGVPESFRTMVGYGDMITAAIAIVALIALRLRVPWALPIVWILLVVATVDTTNAVIQSLRYNVFNYDLGVNWEIVTIYVPALLVSSVLILLRLIRPARPA